MSTSSPHLRTFVLGAFWFGAVAIKMVSRHPAHWSTYPPRNFVVLVIAWIVTALLLGVMATRFERMRTQWAIALGTVAGSLLVMGTMLFTVEHVYGSPAPRLFASTDAMMSYFATEATKWVKQDRGMDLDYSLDSIKVIEEQLGRVAKTVDKANPQRGTLGLAMGYGAYIGEVFRRRDGGSVVPIFLPRHLSASSVILMILPSPFASLAPYRGQGLLPAHSPFSVPSVPLW